MQIAIHVLAMSALVWVLSAALPGVKIKSFGTALLVAVIYGVLNFFLFWLLAFIAFIPMILSLGLFGFVINAFLLWLTDKMLDDFEIESPFVTLLFAFLLTLGKIVLRSLTG